MEQNFNTTKKGVQAAAFCDALINEYVMSIGKSLGEESRFLLQLFPIVAVQLLRVVELSAKRNFFKALLNFEKSL